MPYFETPRAHPRAPRALKEMAAELRSAPFVPHRLLKGPHVQTLLSQRPREPSAANLLFTSYELARGTIVHAEVGTAVEDAPTIVCIHGIGGSSESGYMRSIATRARARGWGIQLLNLYDQRTSSIGRPTIFHAGNSNALSDVIDEILVATSGPLFLLGVSLGGNTTLKLLGERVRALSPRVLGAAVISPLLDLSAAWPIMERLNRSFYRRHFLSSLSALVAQHRELLGPHVDIEKVFASKTLREFDAALTVPLGGFRDVFDFYRQASALPVVDAIELPTLVLFAADDPVLPFSSLMAAPLRNNPNILTGLTTWGGHVGFFERVLGTNEWEQSDRSWSEDRAVSFFERLLKTRVGA